MRAAKLFVLTVATSLTVTCAPGALGTPPRAAETEELPGGMELISRRADGSVPEAVSVDAKVSGNGRYVIFWSTATGLDPAVDAPGGQIYHLYRRDRRTGSTVAVDVRPDGALGEAEASAALGSAISADGRFVVFTSSAKDLTPGDSRFYDVFQRDMVTGTTTLLSVAWDGGKPNGDSQNPTISADGSTVAFASSATNLLAPGRRGWVVQVYHRDLGTGEMTLVSRTPSGGFPTDNSSSAPSMSADGQRVAYGTYSRQIVDGGAGADVVLFDLAHQTSTLVSRPEGGGIPNGGSYSPSISGDGSTVAFSSSASNLLPGDTSDEDVYAYDVAGDTLTLASRSLTGGFPDGRSGSPSIDADGSHIAFFSWARDLTGDRYHGKIQVFVVDTRTGVTTLISEKSPGESGHGRSLYPALSADGSVVSFQSDARDLIRPHPKNGVQVYARRAS